MNFKAYCQDLEAQIISSYEDGVTMDQAEKLAGRFLAAQLRVSEELTKLDLDSRLRKAGNKAVRAAAYLEIVQGSEKKPTEAQIGALIDTNPAVIEEQNGQDAAEVGRDELKRYYEVFRESHLHYRTISKGSFNS